jgi:DNA ligase 1
MDESLMQHGMDWTGQDVSGWIAQEKYDGCRAYWDGARMWSRGGMEIDIPEVMRASLPACAIDGELYHPVKTAAHISNIMRGRGSWDGVVFMAFDMPCAGSAVQRMAMLDSMNYTPSFKIVRYFSVVSTDAAVESMKAILARKGEGIILRRPDSCYAPGRTDSILKMKPELVVRHG